MNRFRFDYPTCWLATIGLMLATVGGCGPRLSSPEFGTILHEIPKVPGTDKPYPMPQLDEPSAAKEEPSASETSADATESSTTDSNTTEPVAPATDDSSEPSSAAGSVVPSSSAPEPQPKQDEAQSDPTTESPE
jgi:hypothetical protein